MRPVLLGAAALAVAGAAGATPPLPPAPRLIVVISVDQFSADLFDEYRGQFTGGLARLASGTVYRNGYQSHAATETCPGHSTILTGTHPARNGIIANNWIDQSVARPDKTVYCAEDERVPGTSSSTYVVSSGHLKTATLGELMKRRWPASRNVAVAGKDRAAVMLAGHATDELAYWNGKSFTSGGAGAAAQTVTAANGAIARAIATPRAPLESPPLCQAKAQPVAVEGHAPVGAGAFARAAGDASAYRASPELDAAVLALSAALARDMRLGQGSAPDILSVSLSATDYVGHAVGTGGQEMCLQLLSLDRDLGDFLAFLDRGQGDYVVALTADHGGDDLPERLRLNGVADAQRADPALAAAVVGKALGARLGLAGPLLLGDVAGDIYIDRGLSAADRGRVLAEALRFYRSQPQIAAVFTRDELARTPIATAPPDKWSLIERVRASFDEGRSGDLVVVLKPHVSPISRVTTAVATHGSPWDYDRRVPILFWRSGFTGGVREEPADTVDIMPTLARMIGLDLAPGATDGHCLEGASGTRCALP